MDALKGFREKDFLEQIMLLQQIESEMSPDAIPGLLDLHAAPLGDQSVDLAVTNTLQAILAKNESQAIEGLDSPSPAIRRLCLRTIGKHAFTSAAPALIALGEKEEDPEDLLDILTALSRLEHPDSLPLFKRHFRHPYPLVSALSVQMVGLLKDESSFDDLRALVEEAETDAFIDVCPLHVLMAVRALSALGSEQAASYMASKIHHGNPTARRILHEGLINLGQPAVAPVAKMFETGDTDEKILAANVLGWIGDKAGADVMIRVRDNDGDLHENVLYAVYEALGRIGALKGLIFLMDGLSEKEPLLLMSVITALDANLNPGVIKKIKDALQKNDAQSARLLQAIAASRALRVFEALYKEDSLAEPLLDAIKSANDPESLDAFADRLEEFGGEQATAHAKALRGAANAQAAEKRVMAVDDSKAMLHFYRATLPGLGFAAQTAENGQEAWDLLSGGETVDLVIVDMNMPVMDGIELTRLIRADLALQDIPIIMATTESQSAQSELASRAGVSAFINKPFTKDALQEKIDAVMQ